MSGENNRMLLKGAQFLLYGVGKIARDTPSRCFPTTMNLDVRAGWLSAVGCLDSAL